MPIRVCHHEYWTPEEIAEQFPPDKRPSIETIRRYIRSGKLHAVKFGPSYLITTWAIHRLLDSEPSAPPQHKPHKLSALVRPRLLPTPRPNFKRALAQEIKRHARRPARS